MTMHDDTPAFPLPPANMAVPRAYDLKVWGGFDAPENLSGRQMQELKAVWARAMRDAGWTLVWVPSDNIPDDAAHMPGVS